MLAGQPSQKKWFIGEPSPKKKGLLGTTGGDHWGHRAPPTADPHLDAQAQLVAGRLHLAQALQVVGPRTADQDLDVVLLRCSGDGRREFGEQEKHKILAVEWLDFNH